MLLQLHYNILNLHIANDKECEEKQMYFIPFPVER